MAIDALPTTSQFHRRLRERIDPVLDATGTWQGSWNLFAPSPDSVNERLFATVRYRDGSTREWSSPDWRAMSVFERFVSFRELEYYDDVAAGATPFLFSRLADHIVQSIPDPPAGTRVLDVTIELGRRVIAPPSDRFEPLDFYLDFPDGDARRILHIEEYG